VIVVDKTALEILKEYCVFEEGTSYMLIMLPRKKENRDQVEREKLNKRERRLCSSMDDMEKALIEFRRVADVHTDVVFRVYVSVNKRSLLKGMREFQKKLSDYQYDLLNGNKQVWTSIERLGSKWKSVLAKKNCKHDRFFMFDIDIDNTTLIGNTRMEIFRSDVGELTTVKYVGKSKNGFVLVCEPFNPNDIDLPEDIELKTDAYVYVDCYN
jgi:hypothetical protein